MSDIQDRVARIAEAAAEAWWRARCGEDIGVPLGVVAALAGLIVPAGKIVRFREVIEEAGPAKFAELLIHLWHRFAIEWPELSIRVGPFAAWLEDPARTAVLTDGAYAVGRAAMAAGLLELNTDPEAHRGIDLLGYTYQELRTAHAVRVRGDVSTPPDVADILNRITDEGIEPGQGVADECAGTGGLLRAAIQQVRARGDDPHKIAWIGVDIDPLAVAALAVNLCLWDAGPMVMVTVADVLAEPDWEQRARAERRWALEHNETLWTVARFLALDRRSL